MVTRFWPRSTSRGPLRGRAGFTLVEVLIIILIIGILIAVAAPSFLGQTDKAYDSAAQQYLGMAWKAERAGTVDQPNAQNPVNTAVAPDDPNAADRVQQIVDDINSNENIFSAVVGGPCSLADQTTKIVVDPATTQDQLIMYSLAGDGKVWRLRAGEPGAPSKGPLFDVACSSGTGSGGWPPPPPPPPCMPWAQTDPLTGDVTAACPPPPPTHQGSKTLFVMKDGDGYGTVSSSPAGVDCGLICSADFATDSTVTLTATPEQGSTFVGWGGDCQGDALTCTVTVATDSTVTAYFQHDSSGPYTLAAATSGDGSGDVRTLGQDGSPDGQIDCGATCSQTYSSGSLVTLRAYPGPTSTFVGWAGACSGIEVTCTITVDQSTEVVAIFEPASGSDKMPLMVSLTGAGTGVVDSNPAGVNCLSLCTESYSSGTEVALQEHARGSSTFSGWSGGPCDAGGGSQEVCVVTMDQAKSVTATFDHEDTNLLRVSINGGSPTSGGTGQAPTWSGPHYPALVEGTSGLEAYWRFDGAGHHGPTVSGYTGTPVTSTIPDNSGHGHELQASNIWWGQSPNMYLNSGSTADSSIFFDGRAVTMGASDNYAKASWAVPGDQPLTLEAWDFPPGGNDSGIVMYVGDPGNGTPAGAHDGFGIMRGCGYGFGLVFGGKGCVISSGPTNVDNLYGYKSWRDLVVTRDAGGTWRLYMDGELVGSTTQQPSDPSTKTYLLGNGSAGNASADLLEAAVYSQALSSSQVVDHFCSANQDSADRIDSDGVCGGSSLADVSQSSGYGAVFSEDGQIACNPNCSHPYTPSSAVILHAVPVTGSHFVKWSAPDEPANPCDGSADPVCDVSMDQSHYLVAHFKSDGGDPPPPIGDPPPPPVCDGNNCPYPPCSGSSCTTFPKVTDNPCWYVQPIGTSTAALACPSPTGSSQPPADCPDNQQIVPVWGYDFADGSHSAVAGKPYYCHQPNPVDPTCPELSVGGSCGPTGPVLVCPPGTICSQQIAGPSGGSSCDPSTNVDCGSSGWGWGGGGGWGGWGYGGWGIYIPPCASYWSGSGCDPIHPDPVWSYSTISYRPCVPQAPVNTGVPTASDPVVPGAPVYAHDGTWIGSPPMSFDNEWQYSQDGGQTWHDADQGLTFNIPAGYEGNLVRLKVTATNLAGSTTVTTAPIGPVTPADAPSNVIRPYLNGLTKDGVTLSLVRGTWSGSPTLHFAYSWQQCAADGSSCTDIAGQSGQSYTISAADVGYRLQGTVTTTNGGGSLTTATAQTEIVGVSDLANTVAPSISGTVQAGNTLTALAGTWTYTAAPTYAFQWQISTDGTTWNNVSGASGRTYDVTASDVGAKLRVRVTATNSGGSQTATSAPTGSALTAKPLNTAVPTVSGSPKPGQALTADKGSWTGAGPISYGYQWQRCDAQGANCQSVSGATSQIYNLTSSDDNFRIRVQVTAANDGGATSASSAATTPVGLNAPANSALPTISGTTTQGQTLTGAHGTWSGSPTSYAYQWLRCDSQGDGCDPISGATGQSYVLAAADGGLTVRLRVSATNGGGSATAESAASNVIQAVAPASTGAPAISGSAQEGQQLVADHGSWSGAPSSYTYQWRRCTGTTQASCTDIASATSSTYTLTNTDVSNYLRVQVTASNASGSATASSAPTAQVLPMAPVVTVLPQIGGVLELGEQLTGTRGSWLSGTTPTYSYQWLRCDSSGTTCAAISGATGQTYTIKSADVQKRLRFQVTAQNSGGTSAALSAATAAVTDNPPINSTLPLITGAAREGQQIQTDNGTWSNSPNAYAYQWQRCDAGGSSCSSVVGATSQSYTVTATDVGHTMRVQVTASNGGGANQATSDPTVAVTAAAPSNSSLPTVTGTAREGQTLTGSQGGWSATGSVSYAYQWQRNDGSSWANVSGATSQTYTVQASDVSDTLRLQVTATNSGGSTTASSLPTATVNAAAVKNTAPPTLSGIMAEGQQLTADPGTWTYTLAPSYAYQWQRSADNGTTWTVITGATDQSYTLTSADGDDLVRVKVTASNTDGSASAFSAPSTVIIPSAPTSLTAPAITGTAQQGQIVSTDRGSWSGNPNAYAYQWQRCSDATPASCSPISGATSQSYTVQLADVADYLRVVVTASNPGGAASQTSTSSSQVLPAAPINTGQPTISGTFRQGQQLNAINGSWSNNPTSFSYQWQSSSDGGATWANLAGAGSQSYTLTAADVGEKIRVGVTAANAGGSATAFSTASTAVSEGAPANTGRPTISGTTTQGQTLSSGPGTWTYQSTPTYAYQWQRSADNGATWINISSATASSYTLTANDAGKVVRVVVTATNAGGSDSASSLPSATVAGLAPLNNALPSISGIPQQARTLTANSGTWTSAGTPSYTYTWQHSADNGTTWTTVQGPSSTASYVVQPADVGDLLQVVVTATNAYGSGQATSPATSAIQIAAPTVTVAPSITGAAQLDATLTGSQGTWSNSPNAYAFQWLRCNSAGSSCVAVAGATTTSYTVSNADAGSTLRFQVTASNAGGATTASSTQTAGIAVQGAPGNTAAPTITGTAAQGQTLTSDKGTWTNNPSSYSYQWQRCDSAGQSCANISGATGKTYPVQLADVGQTLDVSVVAFNTSGSSQAISATTAVVAGTAPVNSTAPSISGTTQIGFTLTLDRGTWANSPNAYAYQWQRCDSAGSSCANVAAATGLTYALTAADVGKTLKATVTASNVAGASQASAAVTDVVVDDQPQNTALPTVSGTTQQGFTLTTTSGSWTATATLGYSYQWQRCDSAGQNCANISGATATKYTLLAVDAGATLRAVVTATDRYGSASARSEVSSVVSNDIPANTSLPTVSGTTQQGFVLTATSGSWSYTATPVYAFQWQRCDSSGQACANISGGTTNKYTLATADVGSTLRIVVTASNTYGTTSAISVVTDVVSSDVPVNTSAPAISGTSQSGQTLTATSGTWTYTVTPVYSFQWQRSTDSGTTWVSIANAGSPKYGLSSTDVGAIIRVQVTAANTFGSVIVYSQPTAQIADAVPVNTVPPAVTGTAQVGQTLTSDRGTWLNSPNAYAYQWQRSTDSGTTWTTISGATGLSYLVAAADSGDLLRIAVIASNPSGATTAYSSPTTSVGAFSSNYAQTITGTSGVVDYWRLGESSGTSATDQVGSNNGTYLGAVTLGQSGAVAGSSDTAVQLGAGGTVGLGQVSAYSPTHAYTFEAWVKPPAGGFSNDWAGILSNFNGLNPGSGISLGVRSGGTPAFQVGAGTGNPNIYIQGNKTMTAAVWNYVVVTYDGSNVILYLNGSSVASASGIVNGSAAVAPLTIGGKPAGVSGGVNAATNGSFDEVAVYNRALPASEIQGHYTAAGGTAGVAPVNTVAPTVSGSLKTGTILSTDNGTWSNSPTSYSYQWQYSGCSSSCSVFNVPANGSYTGTQQSYQIPQGINGNVIRVIVTASNAGGNTQAISGWSSAITTGVPQLTASPTIAGTASVGQVLTTDSGAWTNTPTSYTYQWQYSGCSSGCSVFSVPANGSYSGTQSSYQIPQGINGNVIRVVVTVSNSLGSNVAASGWTPAVTTGVPQLTASPTIAGTASVGQVLSTDGGSWTNNPTSYTYQWQYSGCSSGCSVFSVPVNGSYNGSQPNYQIPQNINGNVIRVVVTVSNSFGSNVAASGWTPAVTTGVPQLTASPTISGTASVGQVLSTDNGSWTNNPNAYSYQWQYSGCTSGCSVFSVPANGSYNGSQSSYQIPQSINGNVIRVVVTVSNSYGSNVAASGWTSAITTGVPQLTASPVIVGTVSVGQVVATDNGSWTNNPTSYTYQWQYSNCSSGCSIFNVPVNGSYNGSQQSYQIPQSINGNVIRVVVTVSNSFGSNVAASAWGGPISTGLPVQTVAPSIDGAAQVGQTLSTDGGSWTNTPTSYSYQWLYSTCTSGCSTFSISGATSATFTITSGYLNTFLRVQVTATNANGSAVASSAFSAAISNGPPVNTAQPTVSGTAKVGNTLTVSNGSWSPAATSYTYQWQQCNSSGTGCTNVAATSQTYVAQAADAGNTLRAIVTASNASGSTAIFTAPTGVVAP